MILPESCEARVVVETRVHQAASGRLTSPDAVASVAGFAGLAGLWRPLAPGRPPLPGGGVGRVRGVGNPAHPANPAQDHAPRSLRTLPYGISLTPTPPAKS